MFTELCLTSLPVFLIDSDVIDIHLLRKDRGVGNGAAPRAANGDIEDKKHRFIEWPVCSRLFCRTVSIYFLSVNQKPYLLFCPLHGIEVKRVKRIVYLPYSHVRIPVGFGGIVYRTVDKAGILTHVFHDVEFAALRKPRAVDVVAQHPERRPCTCSLRKFCPNLHPSVSKRAFVLGYHAGGGVARSLFAHNKGEHAVFQRHVLATGVVLQFVVSPTVVAGLKCPGGGVHLRAVKLVRPD